MNWSQVFTSTLPLIGVIIGGTITYFTQANILNKQLKRDSEKEKENKKTERLLIYNELLKLDGEIQMISITESAKFNLEAYREKVRPLLYSKFHLLNEKVAFNLRKMDNLIYISDLEEVPLTKEDELNLANSYSNMIGEVEKQLNSYRKSDMFLT